MSSRNSTQAKLVAISDTSIEQSRSQSPPPDFIRKMLHYPDPKEAAQIIGEQAGLEFDQKQGSQGDQLKWEQQDLDARYKTSKTILTGLEDKFKNTKQFVKSCALHANNGKDGNAEEKVNFSAWRRQDQISIIVVGVALSVAIVMGAANVYANLMASGQPVFIEQPWIAVFLSMLVPAGSASLKFISNFFEYDKTKKRYALLVYILTALSLFTWTALFALNFSGASGGIDWNSLGEDNGKGALLVWIQLTAEILVAAALFLAAEDRCPKRQ